MNSIRKSIKQTYLNLFIILLLHLIIRYPLFSSQRGSDSFYVNVGSNFLTNTGQFDWVLNPLSYFGFFPYSYPAGIMAVHSFLSLVLGINSQNSVYFLSLFNGIFGCLTIFLFSYSISKDRRLSLLSAFFFPLLHIVFQWTFWRISSRGMFMVVLPLVYWSLFQYKSQRNFKSKAFYSGMH